MFYLIYFTGIILGIVLGAAIAQWFERESRRG